MIKLSLKTFSIRLKTRQNFISHLLTIHALVMTHREQGQGNDQGGPDTQGPGREGQCHCMVNEIGGNLLGYQWHDSLICPVQTYFVPNLIQFDHFWSKNILISFIRLEIKGKFQLCVLDIWNY